MKVFGNIPRGEGGAIVGSGESPIGVGEQPISRFSAISYPNGTNF